MSVKHMSACIVILTISACASQPEDIPTQYVSEVAYQSYTCDQLAMESRRISTRTGELYNRVKKTADDDEAQMGVGLILFWPTLFFLEGGDGPEAAEYARLKGEANAIDRANIRKNCGTQAESEGTLSNELSIPEKLQAISELEAEGLISPAEAEEKRKAVLDQL